MDFCCQYPGLELVILDDAVDNNQRLMNSHQFEHIFALIV